jgi:hypothetical protein
LDRHFDIAAIETSRMAAEIFGEASDQASGPSRKP